ncbi:glycogen debranching protein GlgX [Rhizobium sp. LC145]|uniref:glycogen debranching protein GlgX n=1 Tax=Rhizobium sp. LC145 TaxID=1120688 RepID=UPI00062A0F19|nr:glycogen debranching protein GlgX [Rhizobium sp. LC145]KKX30494.1 glycogen debranching protein [Rhizobium sp. LC145]TKT42581.1 glycogen debranching protein GlgX [Rhizobiaceae bacterium LC148]
MTVLLGATLTSSGIIFRVRSETAETIDLCLFDETGTRETARLPMAREGEIFTLEVEDAREGTRYGYRAHGLYDPDRGLWFDPSKLLVDPYARELDRAFHHDKRLSAFGLDTADLVPKAIVTRDGKAKISKPLFAPGGFIYEVAVKPFTILHPDMPEHQRGTVAALAHPSVIAHLKRIGADAVELMPITAWIDERHLPSLGLANSWGYNPIALMALDPRLCPGGVKELRETVATLHGAGIGVILDLVFNHTGESDRHGATLSMRGLDNLSYYRHLPNEPGTLVNDTGTGNTLACERPHVRRLILDTLRHFVLHAGVDAFRFDLATVLGRTENGFDSRAETLLAMTSDEVLKDRILIAEPWDIGPGGYQLGNFSEAFLEWNDRTRDDIRRYWRGDQWTIGALATRLAGSSDVFSGSGTRSVNFLAAHDGFTLMDLISHERKHNEENGEDNRDGHNENFSWNSGAEGKTDDPAILAARRRDLTALLSTLFATRGAVMLTAGDEGGRSQRGNNNAYAQDNEITWLDWRSLDENLIEHTAMLAALRKRFAVFSETHFFSGDGDVEWLAPSGNPMTVADWEAPDASAVGMILETLDRETGKPARLAVLFNRAHIPLGFMLPGKGWRELASGAPWRKTLPARSVFFCIE